MKKLDCILIADDDPTSNFITQVILKPLGVCENIETVLNGKQAADFFNKAQGKLPELVLLDINMPIMNGLEFLEWCRTNGFSGKTQFAMFSTSVRKEDMEQAQKYPDVIGYIEKPISKEKLYSVMTKMNKFA